MSFEYSAVVTKELGKYIKPMAHPSARESINLPNNNSGSQALRLYRPRIAISPCYRRT